MGRHNKKEKESSQLAESLSRFGNAKNELIVSGRTASKNLIQERRFDEAIRVCEEVLAVDPDDIETVDLKERAIVYLHNPDQFDLHEMQKIAERSGNDSILQKLLRSSSERRVRKTDGGAVIMGSSLLNNNNSGNGNPADKNNNATETGENNSEKSVKLRRSQSEHRPNVLERIKEFERQAKNRETGISLNPTPIQNDNCEIPRKVLEIIEPLETSATAKATPSDILSNTSSVNSFLKSPNPISNVTMRKPRLAEPIPVPVHAHGASSSTTNGFGRIPRKIGSFLSSNPITLIEKENPVNPKSMQTPPSGLFINLRKSKTEILSPVTEVATPTGPTRDRELSFRPNGKPIIKWTDLGKSVNGIIRSQLDVHFFSSSLIIRACIMTTKAEVWASYGWNHVKKSEFDDLLTGMACQSYLTGSILSLEGMDFRCLSGTGTVVRARREKLGVNCTRLNNLLVIVIYAHPVLPKDVAMLVKRFEDILAKNET